jgi:UDP-GlcNAc:undecaprenyl-phosphate/decaprenyl-phosphate GlcNAc-1-phosphate transferase
MVPPVGWYVVVGLTAAFVTAAVTWPARAVSTRVGYVDLPSERKMHDRAVPYGGGAAMFVGFLGAMMVASAVPALRNLFASSSEPLGIILAGAAIFFVGLLDDVREMSPPAKVAGQVLAASILYFLGVTLYQFKVPLAGFVVLTPSVTPLIMAVWVIAITNAVNFIDGLDGLATGVVAIAGGALAVYGIRLMELGTLPADNIGPLVACIACGVCVGFLPFNFPPAKIFMGDAGALFLGLLMSATTMVIGGRTPPTSGVTYFFFAPLFIPLFILGVPLVDMVFAFVRRTAHRLPFDEADKDHIHHRLMRLGHGPRRSVVILWAWTALLSGFVLFPLFFQQVNAVIPFGAAALVVALYTLFHPGIRRPDPELDEPFDEVADGARPPAPQDGSAALGARRSPAADGGAEGAPIGGRVGQGDGATDGQGAAGTAGQGGRGTPQVVGADAKGRGGGGDS